MRDRLYNAIGLCMKAGRAQSGALACEKAVKSGRAKLVLIETRASAATMERYKALCDAKNVPLYAVETVGEAIGKPSRLVMAVTDEAFKTMIEGALPESE